jgi:hypothetical protein
MQQNKATFQRKEARDAAGNKAMQKGTLPKLAMTKV